MNKAKESQSMKAYKVPDIEFKRKLKGGRYKVYGHIYFKPLLVVLFGKILIDRRRSGNN